MYKFRGRLWVKLLALLLLIVSAVGTVGFAAATVLAVMDCGTAESFYEDVLCLNPALRASEAAFDAEVLDRNEQLNWEQLNTRYAGYTFHIYLATPYGDVLVSDSYADGEPYLVDTRLVQSEVLPEKAELLLKREGIAPEDALGFLPSHSMLSDGDSRKTDGQSEEPLLYAYILESYVSESVLDMKKGEFARGLRLYEILHAVGAAALPLAVALGLAAAGLLILAMSCAGHRPGEEKIVPNWQDRIPLDIYLAAAAGLVLVLLMGAENFYYACINDYHYGTGGDLQAAALLCCLFLVGVVLLCLLLTLATRVKMGKWWRNTAIFQVLRLVGRALKWAGKRVLAFFRILPMTWRAVLLTGGILAVQAAAGAAIVMLYGFRMAAFLAAAGIDILLIMAAAFAARQLQLVKEQGSALARGKLDAKVDTDRLWGDIRAHGEALNAIGQGMNVAVEQRLRSERLKTELITNVSHDIKTPLTSIVNYVDLLQKQELPDTASEYLAVLDRQSKRLKKLTEDLVEASKASTGNIAVHLDRLVVNEIIHQAIGDYDDRLAAGKLEVVVNAYQGNVMAMADGRLLWRVLDNLFSNVCKYALAGTRVYVDLHRKENMILLSIKNISRDPLNGQAEELLERFVRGDLSRHTEGSGLGLNIASSLMELMGGKIALSTDGDLFKAELTLKAAEDQQEAAEKLPEQ